MIHTFSPHRTEQLLKRAKSVLLINEENSKDLLVKFLEAAGSHWKVWGQVWKSPRPTSHCNMFQRMMVDATEKEEMAVVECLEPGNPGSNGGPMLFY